MNYKWNVLYKADTMQEVLLKILNSKGIPKEKVRDFIDFKITPYDPLLLNCMDKAVVRINQSINNKDKICIIGDYDADGVTATSVMYIGLRSLFANVIWMVPNRFKDGYGLNKRLVEEAYLNGCKLIITVDNGIVAHEQIKYANSKGIDVIITDHHLPQGGLPTEITIDPHADNTYPYKMICGCMVAFKTIIALRPNLQIEDEDLYKELVAITAIGTIADAMPLMDENRFFVKYGLEYLSETKNIGLKALLEKLTLYGKSLAASDVGFGIGPCINAAGRLDSADYAINLLLCDDPVEADKLADKLIGFNEKRKDIQNKVMNELVVDENEKFIFVTLDNVGHGILGIIAGKISEKYQKPCFVLGGSKEEGKYSGSGRSIYGYDSSKVVTENLDICTGGGHAAACGVSIPYDNFEEFKNRSIEHFSIWRKDATEDDITPTLNITCEIGLDLVNEKLVRNIEKLKPFGSGNEEPIFITKNVDVLHPKVVGKHKNVIQMTFAKGFINAKSVGFGDIKAKYEELNSPRKVDVIYNMSLNEWPEGKFTPQLVIKDIRLCE
jgi:single-stranded-DNA-specific exonuclease